MTHSVWSQLQVVAGTVKLIGTESGVVVAGGGGGGELFDGRRCSVLQSAEGQWLSNANTVNTPDCAHHSG